MAKETVYKKCTIKTKNNGENYQYSSEGKCIGWGKDITQARLNIDMYLSSQKAIQEIKKDKAA